MAERTTGPKKAPEGPKTRWGGPKRHPTPRGKKTPENRGGDLGNCGGEKKPARGGKPQKKHPGGGRRGGKKGVQK